MPVILPPQHMGLLLPTSLSTMSPSSAGPREVITDKEAAVGTGKDTDTPTKEASTTGKF